MKLLEKAIQKRWTPDALTFLSGLLIVLAFPPWNFWPLLWICLVPWLIAVHKSPTPRAACIQGFWLGYFMSLGGFYWVAYVLQEFGNLPWSLSVIGLLLFCGFGQLQFPVFAYVSKWLEQKQISPNLKFGLFFLSFLYAGIDWIVPKLFVDSLGHALYLANHIRQLADIGGVLLLTFIIVLANYSLWNLYQNWKTKKKVQLSPQLGVVLIIIVFSNLYGIFRLREITRLNQETQIGFQAAAIQGNIGDFDKLASEQGLVGAANKVLDTFMSLSNRALKMTPHPDLLIWPETSYPSTFRNPHSSSEIALDLQLENYRQELDVPLLFGGYDHANGKDFNAFFSLTPHGELEIYQKNILLLFGEYIPGAEQIAYLRDTFPQVGNFGRGKGPSVLNIPINRPHLKTLKAGPIICYEALFPNYVIAAARQGSQVIMNITNDSWFGLWGEPQLHLALSTFRSIETRLPMIRSTNTGISALILPDGEITHPTQLKTQEIMNVRIPITAPIPTLMKLLGDWFGPFSLVLGVFWILINTKLKPKQ